MWKSWEFKYFQLQSANSEFNNNIVLGILWANWMMLLCKVMKELFFLFFFYSLFSISVAQVWVTSRKKFHFRFEAEASSSWASLSSPHRDYNNEWRRNTTTCLKRRHDVALLLTLADLRDDPKHEPKNKIATTDKMKRKVVKFMLTMSWDWLPLNLGSVAWCHCIVVFLSIT